MATDEERDGDRTKITLAAHGDTIEIMPGLGGRIIVSLDDGEGSINALVGVEEQEMVIAAIRRAQGREQGATVPRAGVLPILDDLRSIATALDFENTPGACSAWRRLEEAIGTLAKLTDAPTTPAEKG